jgi:hypothetical protein
MYTQPPPVRKAASAQQIQLIWFGFLVYAAGIIAFGEFKGRLPGEHIGIFQWAIAAVAACIAIIGFLLRRKTLALSRASTNQLDAQRRWAGTQIRSSAFALSVILYGFITRMIAPAPPRWFATSFYALGILLLFLWRPTNAPDERSV